MQDIIIQNNQTFISNKDNLRIFYDVYMPSHSLESPIVVQIAHGMVEHKGRYEWVGTHLAKAGYVVVINDHRAHGKSIDSTCAWGDIGKSTQSKSTQETQGKQSGMHYAIDDMHQLTLITKERFKPSKYVLLGHSMGSLLSRGYIKAYLYELDALILSGSPAYNPLVGLGKALAQILYKCKLHTWGKHFINSLSFGRFNKPFLHNKDEDCAKGGFAWLCRDKDVIAAYRADNACSFVFSLQSFIALFELMQEVHITHNLKGEHFPILIISGNCDSCGDFGRGVEKIAKQYQKSGFDVELKLYGGARHEILNEINKKQVLTDIIGFIQKTLS
ncbi:alpha/beta fold hydrolase [Helicobacter mastomyrinus]|uniref:Alpha/beta hydrolase n=5 Tax=Helicobacter TaxID=209 RepID=A0ABZ3F6F2_9HELI|nr:alpha/beta hydrolase [uncultured Helicobacter sp.]